MGLLGKWTKKKEQEQLEAVGQNTTSVERTQKDTKERVKKTEKQASSTTKKVAQKTGKSYRVLLHPIVSEKVALMEMRGVYAFAVALEATKEDIKHAVFQTYGVKPTQVRTSHVEGKRVRFGYAKGKRRDWKKAMVYLPKGMTIHVHEGV